MTTTPKRLVLALALAALTQAVPLSDGDARADITLSLDNPDPTVTLPTTGTRNFVFTGTVTATAVSGSPQIDFSIFSPMLLSPPFVSLFANIDGGLENNIENILSSGGTFTGPIFDVTISSSDPLGKYELGNVAIIELLPTGNPSASSGFTVTLATPTAAPEPSTAVLSAFGAVAFMAYGWSRHRRAQCRQASKAARQGT
jgi:hypothetical protein